MRGEKALYMHQYVASNAEDYSIQAVVLAWTNRFLLLTAPRP